MTGLREFNPYHEPGGSPVGGQFAHSPGAMPLPAKKRNRVMLSTVETSKDGPATPELRKALRLDFKKLAEAMVEGASENFVCAVKQFPNAVRLQWVGDRDTIIQHSFIREEDGTLTDRLHFIQLGNTLQAAGEGKALLRAQMRTLDAIGVTRVTLEANINVGAYAWARAGFLPYGVLTNTILAGDLRKRAAQLVRDRWITGADAAQVQRFLDPPSAQMVWQVADLRIKANPADLRAQVLRYRSDDAATQRVRERDAQQGVLNVGSLLLEDLKWNGAFKVKDAAQRARLQAYIGRW